MDWNSWDELNSYEHKILAAGYWQGQHIFHRLSDTIMRYDVGLGVSGKLHFE